MKNIFSQNIFCLHDFVFKKYFFLKIYCLQPLTGIFYRNPEDEMHASSSCCLVAIGRLQVTSTPNSGDLNSENSHEFVSRHSLDGEHLNFNLKMKLFNNKKYI